MGRGGERERGGGDTEMEREEVMGWGNYIDMQIDDVNEVNDGQMDELIDEWMDEYVVKLNDEIMDDAITMNGGRINRRKDGWKSESIDVNIYFLMNN